jgi:hypothetical protein
VDPRAGLDGDEGGGEISRKWRGSKIVPSSPQPYRLLYPGPGFSSNTMPSIPGRCTLLIMHKSIRKMKLEFQDALSVWIILIKYLCYY